MKFSIEELYSLYGQYDKTIGIYFNPNSESFIKFGSFITGDISYTSSERSLLQQKMEKDKPERNDGKVKLRVYLREIKPKIKDDLLNNGFLASDVMSIIASSSPTVNPYNKEGLKTLPKPIVINVDYQPAHNVHLMSINLNNHKIERGYKLAPFEIVEHNASILFLYKEKLNPQDYALFLDETTGEIRDDINYQYLTYKFLDSELSGEELAKWKTLTRAQSQARIALLVKEMQRSNEKIKELGIQWGKAMSILVKLSSIFKSQRLITSRFPVWLDYERFLHIFMRHVRETKVGERFIDKSVFPYEFNEILDLLKIVIKSVDRDIEKHFETYPEKTFFRKGNLAVYFQGDYFAIEIDTDGRLLTFYKDERR